MPNNVDNIGIVILIQTLKKVLGKLKKILSYWRESKKIKALKNGLKLLKTLMEELKMP